MVWSTKKRIVVLSSVGLAITIFGAIMIPVMDFAIKKMVQHTVIIKKGGTLYDFWVEPPVPIFLQIYMFNITNPQEFLAGGKADLNQVGPYTYSEKRIKYNIIWNENGTVTYRQNRTFHFLPHESVGKESDIFLTGNPVYWALFNAIKYEDYKVRETVNFLTGLFDEHPLMTRTLKEIIWGYHDPLLIVAKTIDPNWFYTDFIGYFINKNSTNDGVYTVFTGAKNISTLGVIDQYNGTKYLTNWSTKWANMINGSDGTLGPPYLPKDMLMYTFASDICRSVGGKFFKDVKTKQGIPLWRFSAPPSYSANATITPDNAGYCVPKGNCLDSGVFNVSECQAVDFFHLPVSVSYPHFLFGAKKYINGVTGLNPNPEEHNPIIDLEPYTGLVMQAQKRLQVNVHLEPLENVSETDNIVPVFLPVFWLNESAVIDDKNAKKFFNMLFTPLLVIKVIEIVVISAGGLVLLCTLFYGVRKYRQTHMNIRDLARADSRGNVDYDTPIINTTDDDDDDHHDDNNHHHGGVDNDGASAADDES